GSSLPARPPPPRPPAAVYRAVLRAQGLKTMRRRGACGPQVEHHQAFILHKAPEARAKVLLQSGVTIQPPEGRPGNNEEPRACLPELLNFADRGFIVRRRSCVLLVTFQQHGHARVPHHERRAPLLTHQDEGALWRDRSL